MRQHSGSPGNVQVLSDLSLSILCVLPADPCNGLYSSLGLPLSLSLSGTSASGALTFPCSLLPPCLMVTPMDGMFDPLLFADVQPFSLSKDISSNLKADLACPA